MKKGDTHVDWAISMGLFLISILMIIIFLKPGVKPLHQEENLLNILEKEFLQTSTWTIKELPLFIHEQEKMSNDDLQPKIILTINDWEFSICEQERTPTQQGTLDITCGTTATIQCEGNPDTCKDHIIHLTYYPATEEAETPTFETPICSNNNGDNLDEDPTCDYTLGATEDLKGIRTEKLTAIKDTNYETLKEQWNYPQEKEFAIYRLTPTGEEKINGGDPFGQKNTYVREIKYWTITKEGERTPLTISIRTW